MTQITQHCQSKMLSKIYEEISWCILSDEYHHHVFVCSICLAEMKHKL
jgi:hypothetical protein